MNIPNYNLGNFYAQSYESPYSMWRRVISANPQLKKDELLNLADITAPSSLYNGMNQSKSIVKLIYPHLTEPAYLTLQTEMHRNHYDLSINLHCKKCAEAGYHTDLFRLNWIKKCPIHSIPLQRLCPTCNKEWPSLKGFHSRKCNTCGRLSLKKHDFKKPLSGQESGFKVIEKIFEFISYNRPKNTYLFSTMAIGYENHHRGICISDRLFPYFQRKVFPEPIDGILKNLGCTFSKEKGKPTLDDWVFTYKSENHSGTLSIEEITKNVRLNALDKILQLIQKQIGESHPVIIYDLRQISPVDIVQKMRPCAYCLSLSYWYHKVIGIPESPHKSSKADFFMENNQPLKSYSPPVPVDKICVDGYIYELPKSFIVSLYEHNLIQSYIWILFNIADNISCMRNEHGGMPEKYIPRPNYLGKQPSELYNNFFFNFKDDQLYTNYCSDYIFDYKGIVKLSRANHRCQKFFQYLQAKYLLPIEKKPINGELTDEEQVTLRYGFNSSRNKGLSAIPLSHTSSKH